MRNKYQRKERKSNHKFEVVQGQELMARVPLPMAEVWAEMQAQVEELTGQAGLQILRAILDNEVTRRVGPPHRLGESSRVMWFLAPTVHRIQVGKMFGWLKSSGRNPAEETKKQRLRELVKLTP